MKCPNCQQQTINGFKVYWSPFRGTKCKACGHSSKFTWRNWASNIKSGILGVSGPLVYIMTESWLLALTVLVVSLCIEIFLTCKYTPLVETKSNQDNAAELNSIE